MFLWGPLHQLPEEERVFANSLYRFDQVASESEDSSLEGVVLLHQELSELRMSHLPTDRLELAQSLSLVHAVGGVHLQEIREAEEDGSDLWRGRTLDELFLDVFEHLLVKVQEHHDVGKHLGELVVLQQLPLFDRLSEILVQEVEITKVVSLRSDDFVDALVSLQLLLIE